MVEMSTAFETGVGDAAARPAGEDGTSGVPRVAGRVNCAIRRRVAPVVVATVMLATGLAFVFFWPPVVDHVHVWFTQWDVWGVFRGAHYVAWGYLGGIYNDETGIVTLPGMPVLLAPVAMLSDVFHLTSSTGTTLLAHPTADYVLMPAELLLAATVVFAADALAEDLSVPRRHRWALCVAVGALAWATAALWGHAEDSLAMTFALYAMVAARHDRWRRAGWLFGLGVVVQPLVALILPLYLAASPRGGRLPFALRCSLLSGVLVGVAFLGNPSGTYRALVEQPTPAGANHPTPWIGLSPRVSVTPVPRGAGRLVTLQQHAGSFRSVTHAAARQTAEVAGGPGRTLYVVLALLLGLYVWRRPQGPDRLLWLAAVVLAGRCWFEAVMTPYYVTPPLILLLVLAARCGVRRFAAGLAVVAGLSVFAYEHLAPWMWWPPVVGALVLLLALTAPVATGDGSGAPESDGGRDPGELSRPSGGPVAEPVRDRSLVRA